MVDTPPQTDTYSTALDIFDRTHPLRVDVDENLKVVGTVTTVPSGIQTVAIDQSGLNNRVSISVNSLVSTDTYTSAGTGTTHADTVPHRGFAVQVVGTGGVATSWNVVVEGSIDGVHFTPMLTHTEVIGDSIILWSSSNQFTSLSYRSRVVSLTLSPATNIVVTVLGTA